MIKRNAIIKNGFIFLLASLISFSCVKERHWGFVDGTPGPGGEASGQSDTSVNFVDVSKYNQARVFPGLVDLKEPRLQNYQIAMNLNYNYVVDNLRISVAPQPQFSTGLYAAPGELVIIDVPEGDYSLSVQIGAWTDNLSAVENAPRDPVIVSRVQLAPGRNYVRNLYGGPIYIYAGRPIPTPVNLVFSNVVKSPDFVLGESNNAQWMQDIRNSSVPYIELRSKNIVFVVPREYCISRNVTDPESIMKTWDDIINFDYYQWEGLSANPVDSVDLAPLLPWRVVQDIKPSVGYGHNGFPVVTFNDLGWFNDFTDFNQIRVKGSWGTLHEIGHNNQQGRYWSWSSLGETSNNLFSFKVAHRYESLGYNSWPPSHPALPTSIPNALSFALQESAKDFDGSDPRIDDPFARLTPFLQIFDKLKAGWGYPGQPEGWEFMTELYKKARRALRISTTDLQKHDFVYEALCDFTHQDMQLFFQNWGIQISNIAKAKVAAKYPINYQEIWKYNPLTRTGGDSFYNPYSRAGWTIVGVSSEEASGEGPNNGRAIFMLDGNLSTFWHSQWAGAQPQPPHWVIFDMGQALPIKGFKIAQRSPQMNLKNVVIETSLDGTNWTPAPGSPYLVQQIAGLQEFPLADAITTRYIQLRIPTQSDLRSSQFAMVSEFDVIRP